MTTQAVPPPGTGGCPRKVFSNNVNAWMVCGTAVRAMLPEELAVYRLGGEDAVKALHPDRELVQWPWT